MNPRVLLAAFLALAPAAFSREGPPRFEDWFQDVTLRVDYYHCGSAKSEEVFLDSLWRQGPWAGSFHGLLDPLEQGRYRLEVRDPISGRLLFSRGFNSLFGEYKTTRPALEGRGRVFHESLLLPMPKKKVLFQLRVRNHGGKLQPLFQAVLDPEDRYIHQEKPGSGVVSFPVRRAGDPHSSLDVAFLGEGYKEDQAEKFKKDAERFAGYLLSQPPFSRYRDRINVWAAFRPSREEGCDEPDRGIWRDTSLGAAHCAFGLPRYCLTFDNRAVQEVAAAVPHDTLAILVNKKRYGGGGIYNLYCLFAADGPDPDRVFLHELGHSFGGLADEYYSSRVAYNDFYPPGVEPREPNITALLDPAHLKWKDLVKQGTPIPTPWGKEKYEALQRKFQAREGEVRASLAKARGKKRRALARELEAMKKVHRKALRAFLQKCPYWNRIGAFEGAGYASKGLYRPSMHCLMYAFFPGERSYCKVCERALERRIRFFLE